MPSDKPDSFQCGPFEVARNPDVRQFVEKLNRLREEVDKNRLQPGVGYTFNRTAGGTSLVIDRNASPPSGSPRAPFPFAISVRQNNLRDEFRVAPGIVNDNDLKIENLNKWLPFKRPARFYIEATLESTSSNIIRLEIRSQLASQKLERVTIEAGEPVAARLSLGTYDKVSPESTGHVLTQAVFTDVVSTNVVYNGYPAVVLVPNALGAQFFITED